MSEVEMPIYEYQCEDCGHKLEKLQKLSDEPLKLCPSCNQLSLTKLVSAAVFRLKGGGWYETDFKTGNKKNVAESETSSSDGSSGSKDSGSKDSGSKDSGSKDSGSKDSGSKDSGSKDSGSKDSGSKESSTKSTGKDSGGASGSKGGSSTSAAAS
jgi:putative FmdB family regulatory protein